jgi:pyruvate/2-oxoglutarate dehydrogenase complex dihydrolipoamide dehydrogenase (E3) component
VECARSREVVLRSELAGWAEYGYCASHTAATAQGAVVVTTRSGRQVRARQLLVATGRRPVTTGLNLDAVGVKTGTRGQVVVD